MFSSMSLLASPTSAPPSNKADDHLATVACNFTYLAKTHGGEPAVADDSAADLRKISQVIPIFFSLTDQETAPVTETESPPSSVLSAVSPTLRRCRRRLVFLQ